MANSRFEYVRAFERDDRILLDTYIVVRIDGHKFHRFTQTHGFTKPNDLRGLNLMNEAAGTVMREFPDINLAFGNSDEFSFLLKRTYDAYDRRESKLVSTITSIFTANYIFKWSKYFDDPLKYPPSFDGRAVVYPNEKTVRDYFSWRQADCHINNLYNTTFWALVQKDPIKRISVPSDTTPANEGKYTTQMAEERLRGSLSHDKNEILFHEYGVNYNNQPEIVRRGSILLGRPVQILHCDLIKSDLWEEHRVL